MQDKPGPPNTAVTGQTTGSTPPPCSPSPHQRGLAQTKTNMQLALVQYARNKCQRGVSLAMYLDQVGPASLSRGPDLSSRRRGSVGGRLIFHLTFDETRKIAADPASNGMQRKQSRVSLSLQRWSEGDNKAMEASLAMLTLHTQFTVHVTCYCATKILLWPQGGTMSSPVSLIKLSSPLRPPEAACK